MPIWFIYAIVAPMIWAVINHIDKFVISRYAENKKPEALLIFSSFVAGFATLLIFCFAPIVKVETYQALAGILAGIIFIVGYIPYMYALQGDEVSIVASLWQLVAVFSYIFGVVFLNETLALHQLLGGLLIIAGAVLMTLNFKNISWNKWNTKTLELMVYASFLIALNTVIFKLIGLESSFWTASLWEYLGAFLFGIFLLLIPSYRDDFKSFVREGGKKIVSLNVIAESMNVVARLFFNFAALLGPIALVYIANGTQPFFIFLYGLILFFFFPKIEAENFSRQAVLIKISAIIVMILGSVMLFMN
jgi:uncharacterized membrane protein